MLKFFFSYSHPPPDSFFTWKQHYSKRVLQYPPPPPTVLVYPSPPFPYILFLGYINNTPFLRELQHPLWHKTHVVPVFRTYFATGYFIFARFQTGWVGNQSFSTHILRERLPKGFFDNFGTGDWWKREWENRLSKCDESNFITDLFPRWSKTLSERTTNGPDGYNLVLFSEGT